MKSRMTLGASKNKCRKTGGRLLTAQEIAKCEKRLALALEGPCTVPLEVTRKRHRKCTGSG